MKMATTNPKATNRKTKDRKPDLKPALKSISDDQLELVVGGAIDNANLSF
jgi:hypothetical protein